MKPSVIFEDKNIIVVNKPAGLMVHGDGRSKELTLVDWLVEKYPQISGVGEKPLVIKDAGDEIHIERPGIVHRLDKGTSGVMVVALNQKSYENLKSQFKNHEISKNYHAIVWGNFKEDNGEVNLPIGRSKKDFRRYSALKDATGEMREALTFYEVLERFKDVTLLKVLPKTGRTHQIRVHMKAINHPIISDELYGPNREHLGGIERPALHSFSIKFKDNSGREVEFFAEYPDDFLGVLAFLRNRGSIA
jgi:23S rRNA pseudouridine1911/1915/1917 synthase